MSQIQDDEQDAVAALDDTEASADPKERFRQALERKNASPGTHPGSQASGANRLKDSNGKRQRQFRRKSG